MASTFSDSEEETELYEVEDIDLDDGEWREEDGDGERRIPPASTSSLDLRMERLPPGQSCQLLPASPSPSPVRALR